MHHAFALAPDRNAIARMFGGAEEGKDEIMGHWAQLLPNRMAKR